MGSKTNGNAAAALLQQSWAGSLEFARWKDRCNKKLVRGRKRDYIRSMFHWNRSLKGPFTAKKYKPVDCYP